MNMNLYDTLGVAPDATDEEIKKAYKKEANKTHPDKEGGDHNRFVAVNKSYQILSDKKSRAEYDRTGDPEPERKPTREVQAMQEIIKIVFTLVDRSDDLDNLDMINEVKSVIRQAKNQNINTQRGLKKDTKKYRKLYKKMSKWHNKDMMLNAIRDKRVALVKNRKGLLEILRVISLIEQYLDMSEYDFIQTITVTNTFAPFVSFNF